MGRPRKNMDINNVDTSTETQETPIIPKKRGRKPKNIIDDDNKNIDEKKLINKDILKEREHNNDSNKKNIQNIIKNDNKNNSNIIKDIFNICKTKNASIINVNLINKMSIKILLKDIDNCKKTKYILEDNYIYIEKAANYKMENNKLKEICMIDNIFIFYDKIVSINTITI